MCIRDSSCAALAGVAGAAIVGAAEALEGEAELGEGSATSATDAPRVNGKPG